MESGMKPGVEPVQLHICVMAALLTVAGAARVDAACHDAPIPIGGSTLSAAETADLAVRLRKALARA